MSVSYLLKSAACDTKGPEVTIRVIGTQVPPARIAIQIAITGNATVQIQARIARDAPWQSIGPAYRDCALVHIEPVQFLRAVATEVGADALLSVWAAWAW